MTPEQRNDLIHDYVREIVDGMDTDTLAAFAFERLHEAIIEADVPDEEFIKEVQNTFPHLLETLS